MTQDCGPVADLSFLSSRSAEALLRVAAEVHASPSKAKEAIRSELAKLEKSGEIAKPSREKIEQLFADGRGFEQLKLELAKVYLAEGHDKAHLGLRSGSGDASLARERHLELVSEPKAKKPQDTRSIPELAAAPRRARALARELLGRQGDDPDLVPALKKRLAGLSPSDEGAWLGAIREVSSERASSLAAHTISNAAGSSLRSSFGPEGALLFDLYAKLSTFARDGSSARDLPKSIEDASRALIESRTLSAGALNTLHGAISELRALVAPLTKKTSRDPVDWSKVEQTARALVKELAAEKGVHLTEGKPIAKGWPSLRLMSEREIDRAELKVEDPEAYALGEQRKIALRAFESWVSEAVKANGVEDAREVMLMGRVVTVGTAPGGEQVVFDWDRSIIPVDEYKQRRLAYFDEIDRLRRVKQEDGVPKDKVAALRSVDDATIAKLGGEVEMVAMTDDKAKSDPLTRLLATKWHDGRQVIVDGRFKGVLLDDLVNSQGRVVETSVYAVDPRTGRSLKRGDHDLAEPYVTLATREEHGEKKEKLFIQLPAAKPGHPSPWTEERNALRALTKQIPTVVYEEGSKNARFYFDPKDLAAVQDAVGGMALSKAAKDHLQTFFRERVRADRATAPAELSSYTMEAIGGFKKKIQLPGEEPFEPAFRREQMEAMAWVEAHGGRGICAIDTGGGKTLVAAAMIQKMIRDGIADDPNTNGRFLFVCPRSLRGNLVKEIRQFFEPKVAKEILKRLDIVTYGELARGSKNGKPFDPKKYVSVMFDEAQKLSETSLRSQTVRAALSLDHPRKICFTASPMEHNPMELYLLSAIAEGKNLLDPAEGKSLRKEMRMFRERYCETFGGRVVGVKSDPLVKAEIHAWVKEHLYHSAQPDVLETSKGEKITRPIPDVQTVTMPEAQEKAYRAAIKQFEKELKGLERSMRGAVALYRDKGQGDAAKALARDKRIARLFGPKLAPVLKKLNQITNLPDKYVEGVDSNPKLTQAAEIIQQRLEETKEMSRTVLFSDDREMVLESARQLSRSVKGKYHAACLSDGIHLFWDGEEVKSYKGYSLPFGEHPYRRDMKAAPHPVNNRHYRAAEWQQFVIGEILSNEREIGSATMHGPIYQQGQNLQAFDTVIHLDRDGWSAENMRQRERRVFRNGQENPVKSFIIDSVYETPKDSFDETLEQIRAHLQKVEGNLFEEIIREAQKLELGREWFGMTHKRASLTHTSRQVMELVLSPTPARVGGDDTPTAEAA
jgi:hypothetical protein